MGTQSDVAISNSKIFQKKTTTEILSNFGITLLTNHKLFSKTVFCNSECLECCSYG